MIAHIRAAAGPLPYFVQSGQIAIRPLGPEARASGEYDVRLEGEETLVVPAVLF